MKLRELSISKGLDNLAERFCDLSNKYLLRVNDDDLNPNIPLSTVDEWQRNRNAGQFYSLLGLGMGLTSIGSLVGGVKEVADMFYHFGNLGAMVKYFGAEVQYCAIMGISSSLCKKAVDYTKNLSAKRHLEDSSPVME